jgi:hypothetical protein
MGKIYFVTDGTYVKIGYTNQEIRKRLQQLSTGSSEKLYILGYVLGDKETEKSLHLQFYKDKQNLEWFNTDNIINWLNQNNQMNVHIDWLDGKLMTYQKMRK